MQIPGDVPEASGVEVPEDSGGEPGRYLVKFRRVPVQIPGKVPEGSGADSR